jgi:hypothetical protein
MAGKGPSLVLNEVEGVVQAIINQAKMTKSRNVYLSHDDLALLMIGDAEWKNGGPDESKNIDQRKNRIRWIMNDDLVGQGIRPAYRKSGYDFVIDPSVAIDMTVEELKMVYEQHEKCKTFTPYDTPFIAPPHFPSLLNSLRCGLNPVQVGPKGSGKSRCFEEAGAILGIPQMRITLGSVHDPADLIGTKEVFNDDGVPVTRLVPGLATEAIMKGWMLILDEFDCVQPQVATSLNMLLEGNTKVACMTEKGIVTIDRHPNSRIVASANTWGRRDAVCRGRVGEQSHMGPVCSCV